MLATAGFGEDAALLDLLVEATQGAFERLVLSHSDFSQSVFTSSDPGLVSHASGARPIGLDASPTTVPPEPPESTRGPREGQMVGSRPPSTKIQYASTTATTAQKPMIRVGRRRKHFVHDTPRVIDLA